MGRCIIILGMHRSATSLMAKGLHEAGVNMGKHFIPPDSGNPHGYYEDLDFVNLNKTILSTASGNWMEPPDESKILALSQRESIKNHIKKLIDKKNESPLWGFKDPRTILTIKLFKPYLTKHFFFTCFRDPVDVARSLKIRNGFSMEFGISLAKEYNRRLFEFLKQNDKQWKSK